VLRLLGIVASPADLADYFVRDPTLFYLIGRTTTAVIGAATSYVIYRIGARGYSARAGLWGAGLLAINVLHVKLSHLITVDVPMTFLALASLYFATRMVTEDSERNYLWAALFAALSMTTKITAVVVLVPLLLAHFYYARTNQRPLRFYFLGAPLLRAGAVFVIAYLVTTPGIVAQFKGVIGWGIHLFVPAQGPDIATLAAPAVTSMEVEPDRPNLFAYYADVILQSMAWPAFVLCLAGTAYALWRRTPIDVILLTFAVCFYLAMSLTSHDQLYYPRYILPVLPVLTLFGGRLITAALSRLSNVQRPVIAALAIAGLAAIPTGQIVQANVLMTREDTRATAKRWIESNLPAGAKVLIEGTRTMVTEGTVPLQNSTENLQQQIDFYRSQEPGKSRYFTIVRKVQTGPTFDLVLVPGSEGIKDLGHYKSIGVEYFVLRPDAYRDTRRGAEWRELVAALRDDKDARLIRRFAPDPAETPGPMIEIYEVRQLPELP
jgi:hypothetical protein